MLKIYADLVKFGIVCFVLSTGAAGYLLAQNHNAPLSTFHFSLFLIATFFLSAGSFALNQYQEKDIDKLMERTQRRPIPSGAIKAKYVLTLAVVFIPVGAVLGWFFVSHAFALVGLTTAFLYNGAYTLFWKKFWAFGAVPGAIPGALPVVMGFAAHDMQFSVASIYLFVLMFLWQMPHFWALALKYKDDYKRANIPVLPAVIGEHNTLYHMGLYTFAYAAWAVASPWFISVWVGYLLVIIPFAAKVVWEFLRFQQNTDKKRWTSFFLWTTFSVIVFVMIPVVDKWSELLFTRL